MNEEHIHVIVITKSPVGSCMYAYYCNVLFCQFIIHVWLGSRLSECRHYCHNEHIAASDVIIFCHFTSVMLLLDHCDLYSDLFMHNSHRVMQIVL